MCSGASIPAATSSPNLFCPASLEPQPVTPPALYTLISFSFLLRAFVLLPSHCSLLSALPSYSLIHFIFHPKPPIVLIDGLFFIWILTAFLLLQRGPTVYFLTNIWRRRTISEQNMMQKTMPRWQLELLHFKLYLSKYNSRYGFSKYSKLTRQSFLKS